VLEVHSSISPHSSADLIQTNQQNLCTENGHKRAQKRHELEATHIFIVHRRISWTKILYNNIASEDKPQAEDDQFIPFQAGVLCRLIAESIPKLLDIILS
jgi:hypothetical protein